MIYTVTVSQPPKHCKPNSRGHWRHAAAAKKAYREEAYFAAINAIARCGGRVRLPRLQSATVQATFYHRNRRGLADPDNLAASLKAVWDGFQDAGLLADDRELTHLPIKQVAGDPAPRVEIVVDGG